MKHWTEKVYLSSGYLSFIFKKETGMNLNRFIRVVRMEKAKELLCSSNMKVAQVSEQVGIPNVPISAEVSGILWKQSGILPERNR